jgi:putative FmdB family regulatory protein
VPIYEFECSDCGDRFERLVDAGTASESCPSCGSERTTRILSSFGFGRLPTANQRRRMEDKRGTDRDGARQRFKRNLARARERRKGPGA